MQLGHQPRDQYRVLVIAFIAGVILGLAGLARQQRLHTHQRHIMLGGKLIQYPPAMPGRLTPHRHVGEPMRVGDFARPVQYRAQLPRLGRDRTAGQYLRVVIRHHHGLLRIGQIDPQNRILGRNQHPQPGQPPITPLVTTRQTNTLNHNVLLTV